MIHTDAFREYVNSSAFLHALSICEGSKLDFSLLGQGEYNANYLFTHPKNGQKLVLRINTGSQMHLINQVEYEFRALQDLIPSGRTPQPMCYDDSGSILPYGTLVMQWLPGRPLDYKKDLAAAAEIFADIHSTPIPKDTILLRPKHPAKAIYEECLAMAEHYFTWDDADKTVCRLLETLICAIGRLPLAEEVSSSCCIVNTEVNSANFLINEGGMSYLVDWEKPLISEPAQDLAHFLAPTTTLWKTDTVLSLSDIRAFTDSYAASVRGRIDFSDLSVRLPLFFTVTCLRGVTWCSMAMREYSREDRPLVNHETRLKLQKYLSTDFLENILENYVRRDFLKGDLTE